MQRQLNNLEIRRQELLDLGYRPGAVQIALDWAKNSAESMSQYYSDDDHHVPVETLLPRYLKDTEKYLKGLGLEPEKSG